MHPSKSLPLGCLMLLAGNALGAASVDLSISATTHPAACDIRLDNGGKVDYGTLQHGDLNPDSSRETLLPARTIGWQINCGYAVPIALQWTDNHQAYGSHPHGTHYFSMGKDARGAPIGSMELFYGDATVADGHTVAAISRPLGSDNWIANLDGIVDNRFVLAFAAPGTALVGAFASYSGQLSLTTRIAPLDSLDRTRVIQLDGSATVEIIYL